MQVALFVTCLGDTVFPEAPKATVTVLERLGHAVVFPRDQTCCGQLHLNTGYSGHGIMTSPAGSRLVVDLITGRASQSTNPFRHDRSMVERPLDIL